MNIGYCCINLSLNLNKKKRQFTLVNRGCTKKTFDRLGLSHVSQLSQLNIDDLYTILQWNVENNILVYRMSSDMFPLLGFYNIEDLPNFNLIQNKLQLIGDYIKSNNIRVSFHPSHFCIIASEKQSVVDNAIDELNKHAQILDLMGLEQSTFYSINIHVGTTKPTLIDATNKFNQNFKLLSESCQRRLTIENDDSPTQYSVKMLYDMVYNEIGIPIVFDQHHFNYWSDGQTMEDAMRLAFSTWKTKPLIHMSSSKLNESASVRKTAHADYIYEPIQDFNLQFDVEIEAKAKDLAVIKYREDFLSIYNI
jgi:UV DNA damage endonuclease